MTQIRVSPSGTIVDVSGAPTAIRVGTLAFPVLSPPLALTESTVIECYTCPRAGVIMISAMVSFNCAAGGDGMRVSTALDGAGDFEDGNYQRVGNSLTLAGSFCSASASVSYCANVVEGEIIRLQLAGNGGVFSTPLEAEVYVTGWLV
jgi:hypothetical protein